MSEFAQGGPAVPWLPRDANLSAIRRTAARLRSGAMRLADPSLDPHAAAWVLERAVEQRRVVQEIVADGAGYVALRDDIRARDERERLRRRRAVFHRLKLSPEARDPESDAAAKARQIHRRRRRELGRPGRRRRNESVRVPLTFVVGNAQHVFRDPYGTSVSETLASWFPAQFRRTDEEPWCSAAVEWRGWNDLQRCAELLLGADAIPHLLNTDARRCVYLLGQVDPCGVQNIGDDPSVLDVGAVDNLIDELERFARRRVLPTDDAALLALPEKVDPGDYALLTYAEALRAAHHARRARLPLWLVQ